MRRVTESLSWNNRSQEPWNHNLHYHRVIVKVIPRIAVPAVHADLGRARRSWRTRCAAGVRPP